MDNTVGKSGNGGEGQQTPAMLDACIRDISRRRMVMAQQLTGGGGGSAGVADALDSIKDETLGASSSGGGGTSSSLNMGGGGGIAGPSSSNNNPVSQAAGTAADSFAQAFVDRFANAQKESGRGGTIDTSNMEGLAAIAAAESVSNNASRRTSTSDICLPTGGGVVPSEDYNKEWRVCDFCKNRAFKSKLELTVHEDQCSLNPRNVYGSIGYPQGSMGGGGGGGGGQQGLHMMHHSSGGMMSRPHHMGGPSQGGQGYMMGPMGNPYSGMMCGDASMMHNPYGENSMSGGNPYMASLGSHVPAPAGANLPTLIPLQQSRKVTNALKINKELIEASKGPFGTIEKPHPLSLAEDKDWITPLHCFVRKHCVEVFTATEIDVQTPSKGKRKPVHIGQIGIRCPHCHAGSPQTDPNMERGSVYYPSSLGSIYNATMNLLQRHLHTCPNVDQKIMDMFNELKKDDARSGTSKKYWVESAKSMGFVDTLEGIRVSAKKAPSPPGIKKEVRKMYGAIQNEDVSGKDEEDPEDKKEKGGDEDEETVDTEKEKKKDPFENAPPLVIEADKSSSTAFSWLLLAQMQPCIFTEADRLGKRKALTLGFAGLACRHCFGGYGSGRFFPSSIKTLSDTSKTLNVLYNHMTRCRKVPKEILKEVEDAREDHDEERSKMKFGSQKAFFTKIWSRLHDNRPDGLLIKPPPRKPLNAGQNGATQRTDSTMLANLRHQNMSMMHYPPPAMMMHPGMAQMMQHHQNMMINQGQMGGGEGMQTMAPMAPMSMGGKGSNRGGGGFEFGMQGGGIVGNVAGPMMGITDRKRSSDALGAVASETAKKPKTEQV